MPRNDTSTIVALSTPRGHGGIAVVRLSGKRSLPIINSMLKTKQEIGHAKAVYGKVLDENGLIDSAVVTFFKAPHSYTGEDLVEISHHGNPFISDLIIDVCKKYGAVVAQPGEFSKRAFLNGKMDLSQAEGVADIVFSDSRSALSASTNLIEGRIGTEINTIKSDIIDIIARTELELDFLDEEITRTPPSDLISQITSIIHNINNLLKSYDYGKIVRNGILCPIVGPPNSGKSSLFNALLHEERVIVSPHPGTTRDFIEESIRVGDYQIRITDTAGIRETEDEIENVGIKRSIGFLDRGDILLYVIDSSDTKTQINLPPKAIQQKTIYIFNKSDIATKEQIQKMTAKFANNSFIVCSAKEHTDIHEIALEILARVEKLKPASAAIVLTRQRHKDALVSANSFLQKAIHGISNKIPPEAYVINLRESLEQIDTILGKTTNDEILNNIFFHFCIGK
jgi:tRNA modification GTPase